MFGFSLLVVGEDRFSNSITGRTDRYTKYEKGKLNYEYFRQILLYNIQQLL